MPNGGGSMACMETYTDHSAWLRKAAQNVWGDDLGGHTGPIEEFTYTDITGQPQKLGDILESLVEFLIPSTLDVHHERVMWGHTDWQDVYGTAHDLLTAETRHHCTSDVVVWGEWDYSDLFIEYGNNNEADPEGLRYMTLAAMAWMLTEVGVRTLGVTYNRELSKP